MKYNPNDDMYFVSDLEKNEEMNKTRNSSHINQMFVIFWVAWMYACLNVRFECECDFMCMYKFVSTCNMTVECGVLDVGMLLFYY